MSYIEDVKRAISVFLFGHKPKDTKNPTFQSGPKSSY